jgi:hypothetical protein
MCLQPRLTKKLPDDQKMLRHQSLLLPLFIGCLPDEKEDRFAVAVSFPFGQIPEASLLEGRPPRGPWIARTGLFRRTCGAVCTRKNRKEKVASPSPTVIITHPFQRSRSSIG